VLCNLKPVAMRGIKSHAMVLAASNEDHTKVRNQIPSALYFALMCSRVDKASQKVQ
jgi:tRNA-binding EMAP/Myf-like protein